jgi:hypothetical protein
MILAVGLTVIVGTDIAELLVFFNQSALLIFQGELVNMLYPSSGQ